MLKKLFFSKLFVLALYAGDGGMLDIDDILSDDDDGDDDDSDDKSKDDKSRKSDDKDGVVKIEEFKNLQELNRQQAEDLKDLKKKLQTNSDTNDKLSKVFTGDEDEAKAKEIAERKSWEEDTPNKVKSLLDENKKETDSAIETLKQEQKLDRIYRDIERVYDVDFDNVPTDVLQQIDLYDPAVRKKSPKKVILSAYKACGKLKRREEGDLTFTEGGGSYRSSKKGKSEAEKYKDSIFAVKKKKGDNVFGL